MKAAEVHGAAANPRGLRHSFAVWAVAAAVPLTMIQKWMGHADLATTAIYLDACGAEERRIAWRMWRWELRPEAG
jgi:integrase